MGVSVKTVRRRIADGTIRAYRIGPRLIRVERDCLLGLTRQIPAVWR
ncbi:MAG: excisionase family DNA-binding protein [Candidatus Nanopelagicales bacterium]